jgi:predicted ATP-grasp superfamily ATP-dependent carboligase
MRASWMALAERFLDGPSLSVHVFDEGGRPLAAEVSIVEQDLRAGERWFSRGSDGRHDRFLPRPGNYTIRAACDGFEPAEAAVTVIKGVVGTDLVLKRLSVHSDSSIDRAGDAQAPSGPSGG